MLRPIAISLSPNTQSDDVLLALKVLLTPRKWRNDSKTRKLEKEFEKLFPKGYQALSFNSGRSALYAILDSFGIGKGDEVIVQAFTCVAVPNSAKWLGAKPVYVDIDKNYNLSVKDLEKKITSKTRAIVIQHTFGVPADLENICKIAKKNKILVIEDCSHSMGARSEKSLLGTKGGIAFFSFGRDKVLSSVFGGMVLTSNKRDFTKIQKLRESFKEPSLFWIFQQLLHPVTFALILPLYNLGLGKLILVLLQKTRLLSKAVYKKEKIGQRPSVFPLKMPGALATLALNQLKKLDKYNKKRIETASFYDRELKVKTIGKPKMVKGAIWLRYPIRLEKADKLFKYAKENKILLGDWYKGVITPATNLSSVHYIKGSCPRAEQYAKRTLNLPTYPTLSLGQAGKVTKLIEKWQN